MAKKEMEPKGIEIIDGTNNFIFTSPHSKAHRRPNLSGALKQGEDHTDYIVRSVCEATDSPGFIALDVKDYDPNFHPYNKNPFKQEIKSLTKGKYYSGLIDIHGLSNAHKYDVAIFYERGFRNSRDLAYKVAQGMNSEKMRGSLIHVLYFKDNSGETISQYASVKLQIPAVQIEVAQYIRDRDPLRENFIKVLTNVVKTL